MHSDNIPAPAMTRYRADIDGLRAVAVLAVFFFHLDHRLLPGGFFGVDVFFVISGFLITSILYSDFDRGRFSLARFYQRRIARIFPAFFVVALATIGVALIMYSPLDTASAGALLAAASLSVANMKLMFQGSYFELSPDAQPYLHYWSLSVEEQFYVVFPLLLWLLLTRWRPRASAVLGVLCLASFAAWLALAHARPTWAFYLLPTRAWELMAGAAVAVLVGERRANANPLFGAAWLSPLGLALIVVPIVIFRPPLEFPGWIAALPVLGVCALMMPQQRTNATTRLLSTSLAVTVGKLSYSLYLWHWPVFSFVDYGLFLSPWWLRFVLKLVLSFALAAATYVWIEVPMRTWVNQPQRRLTAYGAVVVTVFVAVALGIQVRHGNYVDVDVRQAQRGGAVFAGPSDGLSVVLIGDSNASMYGTAIRDLCALHCSRLVVMSSAATDPLPARKKGGDEALWLASLATIKRERPDVVIFAASWGGKLYGAQDRLSTAVEAIAAYSRRIVLLNQPPILPPQANRVAMRDGVRPPFKEEPHLYAERRAANDYLESLQSSRVKVVDVAAAFETADGAVEYLDASGHLLYQDATHLSGYGVARISRMIELALERAAEARDGRALGSATEARPHPKP